MKLLLMRCSRKKFHSSNLPAYKLYDGGNYRILRKFYPIEGLDVRIVSAKYGLITPEFPISYYDVTIPNLNRNEKETLSHKVTSDLKDLLSKKEYEQIFLDLGKDYLDIIKIDWTQYNIYKDTRGIGYQLQSLRDFLSSFTTNNLKDFEIED